MHSPNARGLQYADNRFTSDPMNQPGYTRLRRRNAFTLIELLVVIAILAVLAGIAFPAMQGAIDSAKRGQARNDANQIASAIKAYRLEFGGMTDRWSDLFPKPVREQAAAAIVDGWVAEFRLGNYWD